MIHGGKIALRSCPEKPPGRSGRVGATQCAIYQAEGGHEVLASARGKEQQVALCRGEPPVYVGRHTVRRAEKFFQPAVAELQLKILQPEHM